VDKLVAHSGHLSPWHSRRPLAQLLRVDLDLVWDVVASELPTARDRIMTLLDALEKESEPVDGESQSEA